MSKYCKPMGLYVTYLDCMDCEDKECIQSYGKEIKTMENKKQMKTNKCKYGRIMVTKTVQFVQCMVGVN